MKEEVKQVFEKHLKKFGLKERYKNDVRQIITPDYNSFVTRAEAIYAIRRLINTGKVDNAQAVYGKCADEWDAVVVFHNYSTTIAKYAKSFEMGRVIQAIKYLNEKGEWQSPVGEENLNSSSQTKKFAVNIPQAIYDLYGIKHGEYPIIEAEPQPMVVMEDVEEEQGEPNPNTPPLPPVSFIPANWREEWRPFRYIKPDINDDKKLYICYTSSIRGGVYDYRAVKIAHWKDKEKCFTNNEMKHPMQNVLAWIPFPAFDLLQEGGVGLQFPIEVLYGNLIAQYTHTKTLLRQELKQKETQTKHKEDLSAKFAEIEKVVNQANEHIDKLDEKVKTLTSERDGYKSKVEELEKQLETLQNAKRNELPVKKVIPLSKIRKYPNFGPKAIFSLKQMFLEFGDFATIDERR